MDSLSQNDRSWPANPGDLTGIAVVSLLLFCSPFITAFGVEIEENIVRDDNLPPVADAGADITGVLVNDEVMLDGSNSTDEDISNCTWEWTCASHPWMEITDPDSPVSSFTANFTGELEFNLKVVDPMGLNSTDQVLVTVDENIDPEPNINLPLPSGDPFFQGEPIRFSANGSGDPEGRELSYLWRSNLSGELSDQRYFQTALEDLGWHLITLNVSDPNGGFAQDEVEIRIREPMIAPEAFFSDLKEVYYKDDIIELDGSLTYDGNTDDSLNFTWRTNLSGEVLGYGTILNVTLDEGYHNISLLVTDMDDLTDVHWDHVLVKNRIPVAVIECPPIANVSEEVSISGFRSLDPDGDTLEYSWDFGDDQSASGMNVTHAWNDWGNYNVTLRVDDGSDSNSTDDAVWRIRINTIPEAILPEVMEFNVSERFTISGNLSSDEDGDTLQYSWDFDGDGEWDDTGENGSHMFEEEGEYEITMEVSDGYASDTTTATVKISFPNEEPIPMVKGMEEGQIVVALEDNRGTVTLDGSPSYDPDDDVNGNGVIDENERNNLTFYWDLDVDEDSDRDGIENNDRDSAGKTVRVTMRSNTPRVVALNVTDERGAWERLLVELVGNNVPQITSTRLDPGEDVLVGMEGEYIVYADDEDRADRNKLEYTWDMGDGTTHTGSEITHVYSEPGRYTVRVKVEDEYFNDTRELTVNAEYLQPPVISNPRDGDTVSGEIEIRGRAFRTLGTNIRDVMISFDNVSFVKCNKRVDWTKWYYLWDTTGKEPGTYDIYVKVRVDDVESVSSVTVNVGGTGDDGGSNENVIYIAVAVALLILVLGAIFFLVLSRRKQQDLPPPPGPGQSAPVMPPSTTPPGPSLPSSNKSLPPGPKPDEQKKPEKPQEPEKKELRVRCPACSNIFKVEDTGERPLKMKCNHCGASGLIEKVPGEEEEEAKKEEEDEVEEEEPEPVPIICPSCGGLFELTEMTQSAKCPFCGSEGDLDDETLDLLRDRFGEEPGEVTLRCPRCSEKFTVGEEEEEIECPHCGMKGRI